MADKQPLLSENERQPVNDKKYLKNNWISALVLHWVSQVVDVNQILGLFKI